MAVQFASVSVTTGGVLLSADDPNDQSILFTPPTAIAVGPSGLTYATAYVLTAGVEYSFDLAGDDDVYGYSPSGTVVVPVFRTRVGA